MLETHWHSIWLDVVCRLNGNVDKSTGNCDKKWRWAQSGLAEAPKNKTLGEHLLLFFYYHNLLARDSLETIIGNHINSWIRRYCLCNWANLNELLVTQAELGPYHFSPSAMNLYWLFQIFWQIAEERSSVWLLSSTNLLQKSFCLKIYDQHRYWTAFTSATRPSSPTVNYALQSANTMDMKGE